MGQGFDVSYKVTAHSNQGDVTQNYDSQTTTSTTDHHGFASLALLAENANNGTDLSSRLSSVSTEWRDGVAEQIHTVRFDRNGNTIDGPFQQLNVGLSLLSNDSQMLGFNGDEDMNPAQAGDCDSNGSCNGVTLTTIPLDVRYGRVNGQQAYGPQDRNLTLPLHSEYWNGSSFVVNPLDNCSRLAANQFTISDTNASSFASLFNLKDIADQSNIANISLLAGLIGQNQLTTVNGSFGLTFAAPNRTGTVPVLVDLTPQPWLQFDWSSDGSGAVESALPLQNVTFGGHQGNSRVVYRREQR